MDTVNAAQKAKVAYRTTPPAHPSTFKPLLSTMFHSTSDNSKNEKYIKPITLFSLITGVQQYPHISREKKRIKLADIFIIKRKIIHNKYLDKNRKVEEKKEKVTSTECFYIAYTTIKNVVLIFGAHGK